MPVDRTTTGINVDKNVVAEDDWSRALPGCCDMVPMDLLMSWQSSERAAVCLARQIQIKGEEVD